MEIAKSATLNIFNSSIFVSPFDRSQVYILFGRSSSSSSSTEQLLLRLVIVCHTVYHVQVINKYVFSRSTSICWANFNICVVPLCSADQSIIDTNNNNTISNERSFCHNVIFRRRSSEFCDWIIVIAATLVIVNSGTRTRRAQCEFSGFVFRRFGRSSNWQLRFVQNRWCEVK